MRSRSERDNPDDHSTNLTAAKTSNLMSMCHLKFEGVILDTRLHFVNAIDTELKTTKLRKLETLAVLSFVKTLLYSATSEAYINNCILVGKVSPTFLSLCNSRNKLS
jgi:hypothetical protein